MKLKFLKGALVAVACATALTGGVLCIENTASAEETPATYGLYTTDVLATARGGKTFTQVEVSDAVILTSDGVGDGLNQSDRKVASENNNDNHIYFNLGTDRAYAYNAGNIGDTPEGTNYYQTYGSSQVFSNAYPGGVQRGGEWLLSESIDTSDYFAVSYDISYVTSAVTAGDLVGDSYIYLYGKDKDGNAVVFNKKVEFGVNYWSTGVIEFSDEMVSVERIAVSILWGTVTQQTASGSFVYLSDFTVHARNELTEKFGAYELWGTSALAAANGGKRFTLVAGDSAQIYTSDGTGDGLNQENRKVASTKNDGTGTYFDLYSTGLFVGGHSGGNQRGGEWVLSKPIDTSAYESISFDVGYIQTNESGASPEAETGTSYLYAYGKNTEGATTVINQKVEFYGGKMTTGTIALDGLKTVERIAVSILWNTVTNISGCQVQLNNFTVNAKAIVKKDVSLTANDHALDFYNGNQAGGLLDGKSMRVFHSNTGYAATFGITGGNYAYGTQRMNMGSYVTLRFNDPVRASDYKYFDIELQAVPQIADGTWLAETADKFYFSVLKADASTTETDAVYELIRKQWVTCRINLSEFADEDGYVNRLIFCYTGNNAGRGADEQENYSIQFGLHDAVLTNYEDKEMVAYYAEAPTVGTESISFRLKTSASFRYNEAAEETLTDGVSFNGKTLTSLIADEKASVLLNGNYIQITVQKSEWSLDGTDEVTLTKGTSVREGLTVKDKEIFRYYPALNRFELLPDENAVKKSEISLERVETGSIDEQNNMYGQTVTENSIFVTFKYAVCFNANSGHMQTDMSEMGVWSGATDSYVYELAKQGVIHSCMDLLYVNGKSIREWMQLDYADGKVGLIRVSFMGTWNWGKVFRVMAAEDSNLQLGAGKDMSIEFKAGFVTPMGEYVSKDMYCEISAEEATGPNCVFDIVDKTDYEVVDKDGEFKGGCASSVSGLSLTVLALAVCGGALIKKRKGGREE